MNRFHEKPVIETIKEKYDEIFNAEKKVADFILNNPETALNANVSELANYSGASDATVIRLCKHIGYQGYYQLKLCLSRDIGREQSSDVSAFDTITDDMVSNLFKSFSSTMLSIGRGLNQKDLLECVNMLTNCAYVHIVAVGNTAPLAQYMGFRLGRLGIRATYNLVPEYFINHINLADSNDVVIAVSQSGSSRQVIQAVELAKEKGMKVIGITGYEYSPLSRLTDIHLCTNHDDKTFNFHKSYSHLREIVVIDALLHFLTSDASMAKADNPEIILSEYKL